MRKHLGKLTSRTENPEMLRGSLLSVTGNLESRKAKGSARVGHFNTGMVVFVLVLVTTAVIRQRHMTINNLGRKGFI